MTSSASNVPKRFRLPPQLADQVEALAKSDGVTESSIVTNALEAYFHPQKPDFVALEETIAATLDRLTRAIRTVHRDQQLGLETLAQFVRLYLGSTLPPSDELRNEILLHAQSRFDAFLRAVRDQVVKDGPYVREVLKDGG
ncbi:MAG: hypothetical protein RLO21_05825 [Nitratireductor sp.]